MNLWISLKQEPPRQRLGERCDTRGAEDRAWYLYLIAAERSFYVYSGVPLTIRQLAGRGRPVAYGALAVSLNEIGESQSPSRLPARTGSLSTG